MKSDSLLFRPTDIVFLTMILQNIVGLLFIVLPSNNSSSLLVLMSRLDSGTFLLSPLNPDNGVHFVLFFISAQVLDECDKSLVQWERIQKMLVLKRRYRFTIWHCLRTRRMLTIMVDHNKQFGMHCSGHWFPQLRGHLYLLIVNR